MRIVLGIVGVIAAILLGLYLGLWVCFIGGGLDIVYEIVNIFNGDEVSGLAILWGVIKMCIASVVGYLSFIILFIPSIMALGYTKVEVKLNGKRTNFYVKK